MNDRTMIAAMAMQGMLTRSLPADATAEGVANRAVAYADALIKALAMTALTAESEAERPQFTTSDDQRIVANATGLGEVEFLTPYPSPRWWGARPGEATAQAPAEHDEVGDWWGYVWSDGRRAVSHVSAGDMAYVDDAFNWSRAPQGYDFWEGLAKGNATDADKARAQDFARRVLEAMEAEGE